MAFSRSDGAAVAFEDNMLQVFWRALEEGGGVGGWLERCWGEHAGQIRDRD